MTVCRRFDDEAVPRLERGERLEDPHFASCPLCRAARVNHERLLAALGSPNRLAPPEVPTRLRQEVVAGATTSRGGGEVARPGDRLVLDGETGGAVHAELRLYWNRDRLVVRCAGATPPCRRDGHRLAADVVLESRGSYLPLLILAPTEISPPGTGFETDLAAIVAAGGRVEVGREISVR